MKSGTIFDNFLITNDEAYAEEFGNETWGVTKVGPGSSPGRGGGGVGAGRADRWGPGSECVVCVQAAEKQMKDKQDEEQRLKEEEEDKKRKEEEEADKDDEDDKEDEEEEEDDKEEEEEDEDAAAGQSKDEL